MKTAMQELIEAVNKHYSNPLRTDIFDTNPFLEKEKEQIIEAWKNNREMIYYDIDKDELSETTKIELGKEYYNQTYNQKNNL
jgi:hypothetical protein